MRMNIEEMLRAQEGRVSFHMPGHKMRRGEASRRDTTELPTTDDLHEPQGPYRELAQRLRRLYGAGASLPLVGGSTRGVQLMILTALRPGETLLLPRDAHLSAWSACALGGVEAVPIPLRLDEETGLAELAEEDVLTAMEAHPEARALLLTRPDYYGRLPDYGRIAQAARARGLKLLVDEAHGAHLRFLGLTDAEALGADLWTQSLHKTLPALTPCAVLHLRSAGDLPAARRLHRMLETSSPSSLLLHSMERALDELEAGGEEKLKKLAQRCTALRKELSADARFRGTAAFAARYALDPTRLVIDVRGTGLSGTAAAEALRAQNVDVEMAGESTLVCLPSIASEEADFDALRRALQALPVGERAVPAAEPLPRPGMRACSVREAAFGAVRGVPLERAAGCIAAGSVGLYPPGVPLCAPGERLTEESARALRRAQERGRTVFGLDAEGRFPAVKRRYGCVIFDLDGTLLDTSAGILRSVQYALRGMGLPDDDMARIRRFIGPPLHAAFREYYGMDDAAASEAVRLYRERYEKIGVLEYEPYPGMGELMRDLRGAGVRLAVATGKPERFSRLLLEREGMYPLLEMLLCPDPSEKVDNKPEMVRKVVEALGRDSLMVGDRCFDMRGARANGIDGAGALQGFGSAEELRQSGAAFLVRGAADLRALLLDD